MRIAAAVLLIFTIMFNLFAGFGYLGIGFATLNTTVTSQASKHSGNQNEMTDSKTRQRHREGWDVRDMKSKLKLTGGGLLAFSAYLMTSVVLLTIAVVFLFSRKRGHFIISAAVAGILAEVVGIYLLYLGVSNTIGIIACTLAIIAGIQIQRQARA